MTARLHEDGSVKPRRCPKCGALPASYRERWAGHAIIFEADEQGRPSKEGDAVPGTPRGGVLAKCACGHEWWLRGVLQITHLEQQPEKAVS